MNSCDLRPFPASQLMQATHAKQVSECRGITELVLVSFLSRSRSLAPGFPLFSFASTQFMFRFSVSSFDSPLTVASMRFDIPSRSPILIHMWNLNSDEEKRASKKRKIPTTMPSRGSRGSRSRRRKTERNGKFLLLRTIVIHLCVRCAVVASVRRSARSFYISECL